MFAADMNIDQVRDYYINYNIRIITYNNIDGTHQGLHKVLKCYNPFICKRGSPFLGLEPVDETVATLGIIYVYFYSI